MRTQDICILPSDVIRGQGNEEGGILKIVPDQEGFVEFRLPDTEVGKKWQEFPFLVMVAVFDMDAMARLGFRFYKKGEQEPSNTLSYQMVPTQRVTILVTFANLRSAKSHIRTLPGMYKGHCSGMPASIKDMDSVSVLVHPGESKVFNYVKIEKCYLAEEAPPIYVEGTPMVDPFGQWIQKDWDTKTHSEAELVSYLREEYERAKTDCHYPDGWSRFGGTKEVRFEATGYFRREKTEDRWWLVDPDGYGFFSNGVCYGSRMGVHGFVDGMESLFEWLPDESDPVYKDAWTNAGEIAEYVKRNGKESGVNRKMFNFARANMIRAFGADGWWDAWQTINTARLKRWGFNTIGVGVNNYFDEKVTEYLEKAEIPFVWTLKEFPQTKEKIFRDFPDVYAEEYKNEAERFAREQLGPLKDNPYLIGYFINNEPEWKFQAMNLAERLFAHLSRLESKEYVIAWLKNKYHEIGALNEAWTLNLDSFEDLYEPRKDVDALSEAASEDCVYIHDMLVMQYEKTVAESLKKVDPHHLDLGMRYGRFDAKAMGGCENHDVFSFNFYGVSPLEKIKICTDRVDMPVIIGEYHIGSGDKGNLAHGLLASPTQDERGKALEYYMQRAMSHPNCVGAHYFEMNDQPLLGRFDGECMAHGLIDVCNRTYEPLIRHLLATNLRLYDFVQGRLEPTEITGSIEKKR